MKRLLEAIKNFFCNLFGIYEIHYIDLLDEYEVYIRGLDLSKKNALVGTVRNVEQYQVNYKKLFYHAPVYYVPTPQSVEYVALYRSKNLFEENSGIMHYGKVSSYSIVERCDIKEIPKPYSHEKYYRFEISEWYTLERTVKVRESGPHVCMMTNRFFLENARYFNELLISDNDEFKLHLALMDITYGVYDGFFVGDSKVHVKRNKITVITPKGKKHIKISDYKASHIGTLKIISEMIFERESQQ